jgi:hypothetical protein
MNIERSVTMFNLPMLMLICGFIRLSKVCGHAVIIQLPWNRLFEFSSSIISYR